MLNFLDNKQLYEHILKGEQPKEIVRTLAYDDPITDTFKIGNVAISEIKLGNTSVSKIAVGSTIIYEAIP
jgi:hypothetical protein